MGPLYVLLVEHRGQHGYSDSYATPHAGRCNPLCVLMPTLHFQRFLLWYFFISWSLSFLGPLLVDTDHSCLIYGLFLVDFPLFSLQGFRSTHSCLKWMVVVPLEQRSVLNAGLGVPLPYMLQSSLTLTHSLESGVLGREQGLKCAGWSRRRLLKHSSRNKIT